MALRNRTSGALCWVMPIGMFWGIAIGNAALAQTSPGSDDQRAKRCLELTAGANSQSASKLESAQAAVDLETVADGLAVCRDAAKRLPPNRALVAGAEHATTLFNLLLFGNSSKDKKPEELFAVAFSGAADLKKPGGDAFKQRVLGFFLGSSFEYGVGTKIDRSAAKAWYDIAAKAGNRIAARELKRLDAALPAPKPSVVRSARASCDLLLKIQNGRLTGDLAKEIQKLRRQPKIAIGLAQECTDKALAASLGGRAAGVAAPTLADLGTLAGHWVGDYWLAVDTGLVVPNVELLILSGQGGLKRRVLRWSDPEANDLNPLLASGRLRKSPDGKSWIVADLATRDVPLESGGKMDKARRQQIVLAAMPDLSKPLRFIVVGNRMAIRGTDHRIRTYSRYDKVDIARAHALIFVAEISASRHWPCIISKFSSANPDLAKLRSAGDIALKSKAILDRIESLSRQQSTAAARNEPKDATITPKLNALDQSLETLNTAPAGKWFREQAESSAPFGCANRG